jgi:hypothetical protein
MTLENKIRLLAGSLILLSLSLTVIISPYWLFLALFVGLNLIQSSFTKFCPAEIVIKRLCFKSSHGGTS